MPTDRQTDFLQELNSRPHLVIDNIGGHKNADALEEISDDVNKRGSHVDIGSRIVGVASRLLDLNLHRSMRFRMLMSQVSRFPMTVRMFMRVTVIMMGGM
jgi:hypothetical protein